jgi:hypothetical protein
MGKEKPRHNPYKKQNCYGKECLCCETIEIDGVEKKYCHRYGTRGTKICNGNPYNCCKVKYHIAASRSDTQKINNVEPKGLI